jgi:hypothetical protein
MCMSRKQRSAFSLPEALTQNPASLRNGGAIFYHWNEQLQALPESPWIPSQGGWPAASLAAVPGDSHVNNTALTFPVNVLKRTRMKSPPPPVNAAAGLRGRSSSPEKATENTAGGSVMPLSKGILPANKAKTATARSVPVQRILPAPSNSPVHPPKRSAKSIQPIKLVRKESKETITKKIAKPKRRSSNSDALAPIDNDWHHLFRLLQAHKEMYGTCTLRQYHIKPPVRNKK